MLSIEAVQLIKHFTTKKHFQRLKILIVYFIRRFTSISIYSVVHGRTLIHIQNELMKGSTITQAKMST